MSYLKEVFSTLTKRIRNNNINGFTQFEVTTNMTIPGDHQHVVSMSNKEIQIRARLLEDGLRRGGSSEEDALRYINESGFRGLYGNQ
jgi:hypothetical protein